MRRTNMNAGVRAAKPPPGAGMVANHAGPAPMQWCSVCLAKERFEGLPGIPEEDRARFKAAHRRCGQDGNATARRRHADEPEPVRQPTVQEVARAQKAATKGPSPNASPPRAKPDPFK